jgi:hypothetical protein
MPAYTQFDSSVSLAILEEALGNQHIKNVLSEIGVKA